MTPFKKSEVLIIVFVLSIIGVLTFFNLQISLRRSRDFQRKEDIKNIANGVFLYYEEFGYYPPSDHNGKIVACGSGDQPCKWGWDSIPPYLENIPADPRNQAGFSYKYASTREHFQIFASLEGKDEAEYMPEIEAKGFICGNQTCNFGRSDGATPLDKSLEEYENELREKAEEERRLRRQGVKQ